MNKKILITGATGFLGSNLMMRILKNESQTNLVLLIRARSDDEAKNRINMILKKMITKENFERLLSRVEILKGNIIDEKLGLSNSTYERISRETTHIIHYAASVKLNMNLEDARNVNCNGTKNIISFAKCANKFGVLERLGHISTAYVAGNRTGTIYEDEFAEEQKFANTYEQTKFEAEQLVREYISELPITIFRPSIIVGDSNTGATTSFNVLYSPLRLIYHGYLKMISGFRNTPMDVVSVDFVADSVSQILLHSHNGIGKTFHLTAGKGNTMTAGEIIDEAVEYFNQRGINTSNSEVEFCPPNLFKNAAKQLCDEAGLIIIVGKLYEAYVSIMRFFDNNKTLNELRDTLIKPKPLNIYYNNLLAYCVNTEWGKREMQVAQSITEKI